MTFDNLLGYTLSISMCMQSFITIVLLYIFSVLLYILNRFEFFDEIRCAQENELYHFIYVSFSLLESRKFRPFVSLIYCILQLYGTDDSNELGHEKMCLMPYANNKGADQPPHPRSLISAFVVRCLDSMMSLNSIAEISSSR